MSNIAINSSIFVTRKLGDFQKLKEEYDVLNKKLGEGFFGSVEVVQLKGTKQNRAMKKIDKQLLGDKLKREDFVKEIDILKTLDHPNILKVYEFYEDNRYLYIITELCVGRELFDVIVEKENETFSELDVMKIMQQALSALQYAHDKFFTHRDIKPENIMIDPQTNKIKIIDWGASTSFKDEKIKQLVGSAYYIAPEILKKRGYNEKVDIWSIGIVMYLLITGETPFDSEHTQILFEEIKTFQVQFNNPIFEKISPEAKDLLQKMLKLQPAKRITAAKALQHPWFSTQPSKIPQKLLKNKLGSLKSFQYQSKLQMATISYVASHLMSQTEKDEIIFLKITEKYLFIQTFDLINDSKYIILLQSLKLSELFIHLDTNKDGRLSKDEIYQGYKNLYGEQEAQEIVDKIFNEIDVDRSGTIDYNEFLACTMNQQKLMNQTTLKRAFDLFDVDGDQQITAKEIKNILQSNADTLDSEMWDSILSEVDKDGNGVIDFQEFSQMMDVLAKKQATNKRQSNLTPFQIMTRSHSKSITQSNEQENNSPESEIDEEDDDSEKNQQVPQNGHNSTSKNDKVRKQKESINIDSDEEVNEKGPKKQQKK